MDRMKVSLGFVHLASLKFMTLRPARWVGFADDMSTIRVRVEILKSAFDACDHCWTLILGNSGKRVC
ncbi:hypothetical protein Pyn_30016 [Prunus yedoensis var. nudiflora]|uniref:Uncharacterized protein n=1 Tax=Prunus yedoensis var. nudiflora TaxID=2094558 RepID=A0A314YFZ7_PRUYE|nr:hypothetical protein Pyn_30016 [Prunus yedoensis var. nudiflora]